MYIITSQSCLVHNTSIIEEHQSLKYVHNQSKSFDTISTLFPRTILNTCFYTYNSYICDTIISVCLSRYSLLFKQHYTCKYGCDIVTYMLYNERCVKYIFVGLRVCHL